MKILRKTLLASALILGLLAPAVLATSSHADDQNPVPAAARQEVWQTPEFSHQFGDQQGRLWAGYVINGGLTAGFGRSTYIEALKNGNGSAGVVACDSSLSCLKNGYNAIQAIGVLDLCANTGGAAPCVDSVEYKVGDVDFKQAQFEFAADASPQSLAQAQQLLTRPGDEFTNIQTKMGWSASAMPGVPASSTGPLVFSFPGAVNSAGTETYSLADGFMYSGDGKGKGAVTDFDVSLQPVLIDKTQSGAVAFGQYTRSDGTPWVDGVGTLGENVAYIDAHSKGFAAQFPANLRVRVNLRLNSSIGGWFQGRLDSPQVGVVPVDSNTNLVSIEASPTKLPITAGEFVMFDPANQNILDSLFPLVDKTELQKEDQSGTGGFYMPGDGWTPTSGTAPISLLAGALGTKAKGFISTWEFRRLVTGGNCFSDNSSLQGLLTTNAMTYQAGLPTYTDGFLNYSVAGLHYDSDGNVFQGTYSFIMKDSVAKCLYGFSGNGPISGSVSVTSSDGQENVASTSVSDADGWLKLNAQGFTFSNPTIKAKLTQAAIASAGAGTGAGSASTPSPTPVASKTVKTITCKKNKTVRNIKGTNPKCPAGFKRVG